MRVNAREKLPELISLLQKDSTLAFPQTVIFCNTVKSCRAIGHALEEAGFAAVGYHGAMPASLRGANFEAFCNGSARLLICTDLFARGLDLNVSRVVNFDMPQTLNEYLHRVGRTARAGREGTVLNLYSKREEKSCESTFLENSKVIFIFFCFMFLTFSFCIFPCLDLARGRAGGTHTRMLLLLWTVHCHQSPILKFPCTIGESRFARHFLLARSDGTTHIKVDLAIDKLPYHSLSATAA